MLTHRNTSRWARRIIKKGLAHLPGTREAMAEQLRIGEALRKKAEALPHRVPRGDGEGDGSDESFSSEGDDDDEGGGVEGGQARSTRAEVAAIAADVALPLEAGADRVAKLLRLPFMARAAERQRAAAAAEAASLLAELDEEAEGGGAADAPAAGRRRMGPGLGASAASAAGDDSDDGDGEKQHSDEEGGDGRGMGTEAVAAAEGGEEAAGGGRRVRGARKKGRSAAALQPADAAAAPAVALVGAAPLAKLAPSQAAARSAPARAAQRPPRAQRTPGERMLPGAATRPSAGLAPADPPEEEELEELVGGVSSKQRELIKAAFAGDDVEEEFAAQKAEDVEADLPNVAVDKVLPGWGSWASQQREPRFIRLQRQKAEELRKAAAAARQDARKPNVIISERYPQKAETYNVVQLPFPFKSREVFEASMRMPLGRETNTDAAMRNLTRPKVLQRAGAIIDPISSRKVAQHAAQRGGGGEAAPTKASRKRPAANAGSYEEGPAGKKSSTRGQQR